MHMYQWKQGSRFSVDAQVAGETLDQIREREGGITAEAVVDESRPPEAPLHPEFTWDDQKAAEEYRKEEARRLIRSVIVLNPRDGEDEQQPIRAFVVVNENGGESIYTSTVHALQDKDQRRQVLERALREMESFQRKYHEFEELAEAIEAAATASLKIREQLK